MNKPFRPKKFHAALLALLSLSVGLIAHYFCYGVVRNHIPDASWLIFGILSFYAIWGDFKKSKFPLMFALIWEISEIWIPQRVFDYKDLATYLVVYLIFSQFIKERTHT